MPSAKALRKACQATADFHPRHAHLLEELGRQIKYFSDEEERREHEEHAAALDEVMRDEAMYGKD